MDKMPGSASHSRDLGPTIEEVLAAIAEPTRLRILRLIAGREKPYTVGAIAEGIGSSDLSNISRHIKILCSTRIMEATKHGKEKLIVLRPEVIERVFSELETLFKKLRSRASR